MLFVCLTGVKSKNENHWITSEVNYACVSMGVSIERKLVSSAVYINCQVLVLWMARFVFASDDLRIGTYENPMIQKNSVNIHPDANTPVKNISLIVSNICVRNLNIFYYIFLEGVINTRFYHTWCYHLKFVSCFWSVFWVFKMFSSDFLL